MTNATDPTPTDETALTVDAVRERLDGFYEEYDWRNRALSGSTIPDGMSAAEFAGHMCVLADVAHTLILEQRKALVTERERSQQVTRALESIAYPPAPNTRSFEDVDAMLTAYVDYVNRIKRMSREVLKPPAHRRTATMPDNPSAEALKAAILAWIERDERLSRELIDLYNAILVTPTTQQQIQIIERVRQRDVLAKQLHKDTRALLAALDAMTARAQAAEAALKPFANMWLEWKALADAGEAEDTFPDYVSTYHFDETVAAHKQTVATLSQATRQPDSGDLSQ